MNAKQGTILLAAQMTGLLERLDKTVFTRPLPLFNGGTIGQHVRHILECYVCLLEGGRYAHVDYSSRQRNATLSECPGAALAVLDYIAGAVKRQDEHQWMQIDGEFPEAPVRDERPVYFSSMGRELQYAFEHAVHHLAMIRIGLEAYFPEIPVEADLGVAPSTLKYRRGQSTANAPANPPRREPALTPHDPAYLG